MDNVDILINKLCIVSLCYFRDDHDESYYIIHRIIYIFFMNKALRNSCLRFIYFFIFVLMGRLIIESRAFVWNALLFS